MITASNVRIFEGKDFSTYQQLPGRSYSSFKSFTGDQTYKMKLGTALDTYLTDPANYDGFEYELIRPAAAMVRERIGPIWNHLQKQLSVTADFNYGGFTMPYRGRPDFAIPGKIVIDLKFVEDSAAVDHFGYIYQQSGYCIAMGANTAFILEMSRKKKAARFIPVKIVHDFWIEKVLQYGEIKK